MSLYMQARSGLFGIHNFSQNVLEWICSQFPRCKNCGRYMKKGGPVCESCKWDNERKCEVKE